MHAWSSHCAQLQVHMQVALSAYLSLPEISRTLQRLCVVVCFKVYIDKLMFVDR